MRHTKLLIVAAVLLGWLTLDGLSRNANLALSGDTAATAAQTPATAQAPAAARSRSADIPPEDGKLRIIAFGAHPDDAEFKVGGTAAKWAALGHHVKLVSVTNGDIGHWKMSGGALSLNPPAPRLGQRARWGRHRAPFCDLAERACGRGERGNSGWAR